MKKKILWIATGGTIASVASDNGLLPNISGEYMLEKSPELLKYCDIEVAELFSLDSTNIQPEHWLKMANLIQEKYYQYDGFLLTHGTDTMAYTAAALTYLIQGNKPIVLTGSQRPLLDEYSDGKKNLLDSVRFLKEGISGVYIVFDGKAILGSRARKVRSKSFAAFESINFPPIAYIDEDRVINYLNKEDKSEGISFYHNLNNKVFLLKLIPGIKPDILEYLSDHYDYIVIESYGVGGIPFEDEANFLKQLKALTEKGKIVVLATQVMHEGSDALRYEVGRLAMSYNVLQAYDMTIEAVCAKLMWIGAYWHNYEDIKTQFYSRIANDIYPQEEIN